MSHNIFCRNSGISHIIVKAIMPSLNLIDYFCILKIRYFEKNTTPSMSTVTPIQINNSHSDISAQPGNNGNNGKMIIKNRDHKKVGSFLEKRSMI